MVDTFDANTRSRIMGQVKGKDTRPEVAVRRALHAAGLRFRIHRADLPGAPDIVLPKHRTVVFVNGCFWHWHGCPRCRMPATNVNYWRGKIARNCARDKRNRRALNKLGWRVRAVWECRLERDTLRLVRELTAGGAGQPPTARA